METLLDNKSDNFKFFHWILEPDQQICKQILLRFYTVAYEPILRHWSLCTPTENISPFFMFSGSIERDMWHEVGLKVVSATFLLVCFVRSKRKDLWNKEKCFLFHFESSFRSWNNQILNFQIFKCHYVIKCLSMKHEIHFIEWLRKQTQSGNEIWPVYVTLQDNFFYHKIIWKLVSGLFNCQRNLCKKESDEASMLIWTNFDSFAITYLI